MVFMFWAYRNLKKSHLLIGAIVLLGAIAILSYGYFYGMEEAFTLKSKNLKRVYGFIVGAAFAGERSSNDESIHALEVLTFQRKCFFHSIEVAIG